MEVDDGNFEEEVIEKSKKLPVLVDFFATWCGPCHIFSPVIEKIGEDYKGKLVVATLDVDKSKSTASKYGVMSMPTVKLFKDGEVVDEFVGARGESQVKQWLVKNGIN